MSRRARQALIVITLLAGAALILRANARSPTEPNWIDRGVLSVFAPFQSVLSGSSYSVSRIWGRYLFLVGVEETNRHLAEENARLKLEVERTQVGVRRAAELERLIGLRATIPSETIAARVIGLESSPYFRTARVKIDRGSAEIKPGMPVLAATGVVGAVRKVFGSHSDVLLAIDPESSIDVVVLRTGTQGTVRGSPGDRRYRARVLRADEVHEGDLVVTSGNDGLYPRDLPVGTVAKVESPEAGLWKEADIAPSVDFARLREVLVVLAPPPPPDPDFRAEGGKHAHVAHRGLGVPR